MRGARLAVASATSDHVGPVDLVVRTAGLRSNRPGGAAAGGDTEGAAEEPAAGQRSVPRHWRRSYGVHRCVHRPTAEGRTSPSPGWFRVRADRAQAGAAASGRSCPAVRRRTRRFLAIVDPKGAWTPPDQP